ncbi:MAG: fibronectin type III domain-containing protein, partial [Solirubrobacteraceae bacterium]
YAQSFDTGFCGWHSPLGEGRSLAFIPYEGQSPFERGCAGFGGSEADITTSDAASHEYAESVTDPDGRSGWIGGKKGEEVADLCDGKVAQMADGAWVTELWDDAKGACEAEDDDPGLVEVGPYIYPEEGTTTAVTHTSATLEGSLAPCGLEAHYYFEYGVIGGPVTRTPAQVTPAGAWEYVPYRASIEGLQPGADYEWRLVVETSDGIAVGREQWFATPPYVELYSTSPEEGVGATEATLHGLINPEGEEATYYFEYGTTEAYGSRTAEASAGAGTEEIRVGALLSGLTPSTVYHYQLVAKDSHGTFHNGDNDFVTGGDVPVETVAATAVGATGASLHGTVGTHQGPAGYYFEYGTTEAYGSDTPELRETLNITIPFQLNEELLTGLAPDTLYHYRIVATDSYGTSYGSDQTFTTKIAPSAKTGEATHISETGATLTGTLDPNGVETKYHFEYQAGTASSSSTTVEAAGSGTGTLQESTNLTGLTPGTTYHYRLVSSNEFAVVDGEEKTFTTTSLPHTEPETETHLPGGLPTPEPTQTPPASTTPVGTPPAAPVESAPAFSDLSLPSSAQHGIVSVGLTIATAGSTVEIVATLDRPAHAYGGHRRAPLVLGRIHRAGLAAGHLKLTVALNTEGRRELRRHRHLTVTVTILVQPPTGPPRTATRTVTLAR